MRVNDCNYVSRFVVVFLYVTIFLSNFGFSQDLKKNQLPRGAQYFLGNADELLIKVNIWGFVNKPGQYMVPSETDLISLISYAGGPLPGAKMSTIKIVRKVSIDESKDKIIKVDVRKYLIEGNYSLIPQLRPDDTIVVSGSKWHYVNASLEFVTKIALLAQIYSWITYYSDKN